MIDLSEIIWRGCNPLIAEAIQRVVGTWKGYSTDPDARRSVVHLIKKFVDPAVAAYMRTIPENYHFSILGGNGNKYSEFVKSHGYDEARRLHKEYEKAFTTATNYHDAQYNEHLYTLSTLYDFIWMCERSKPKRLPVRDKQGLEEGLDRNRDKSGCRICGSPTEFASFMKSGNTQRVYNQQRYSYKYCSEHRSLKFGETRSCYKTNLRNVKKIDTEFYRIFARSNTPICDKKNCESSLINYYFYNYVRKHNIRFSSVDVIKKHACGVVQAKITDQKKFILALQYAGYNQSEITKILNIKHRQSVSKALASIPDKFKLV